MSTCAESCWADSGRVLNSHAVSEASKRYSFLDDIESAMAMPAELFELPAGYALPLPAYYVTPNARVADNADIGQLAKDLWKYDDVHDALRDHLRLQLEDHSAEPCEFRSTVLQARHMAVILPFLEMKSILVDYVSLLNWGLSARTLCLAAMGGDVAATLRLLQVDKSAVAIPEIASGIVAMQLRGDWDELRAVGSAIGHRPLNSRADLPKAVAIVARYWSGSFEAMTFAQTVDLLQRCEVVPRVTNYDYLRKQLYKVGLTKPRYNRK